MQNIFFDIPAGTYSRSPELQGCVQQGFADIGPLRCQGYDRVRLQGNNSAELYTLMENITFQESIHWILREEGKYYRQLLEPEDYMLFRQQAQRRIEKLEPQLRTVIRNDIETLMQQADCFNVGGYLRFSAQKLKRVMRRQLAEEYKRLEEELEQEEFLELLRFFVSVQPSLLDEAHLYIHGDGFNLTDEWGNNLKQIYLDSLSEEDIEGVSDNDLIMSILITLLPRMIYLQVEPQAGSREFLFLLQQVFGEQLIWQKTDSR